MNIHVVGSLQAIIQREKPYCHLPPTSFCGVVQSVINKSLKETESGSSYHPSPGCNNMETCHQCLILSTLSAVNVVLNFYTSNKNCHSLTIDKKINQDVSNVTNSESTNAAGASSTEDKTTANWYFEASKSMLESNIAQILIQCLKSHCKFITYLTRKIIIKGVKEHYFKVSDISTELQLEWKNSYGCYVSHLELMRDMMSQRLLNDSRILDKAYKHVKELDFHVFAQRKIETSIRSIDDTLSLLNYLSLLHKLVKYEITAYEKCIEEYYFVNLVTESLLPQKDAFFSIPISLKGHLVCLKYFRIINTILDLKFLEHDISVHQSVWQISSVLGIAIPKALHCTGNRNLFSIVNFVGTIFTEQSSKRINDVSTLARLVVLVNFKALAFTLKKNRDQWIEIVDSLQFLWSGVYQLTQQSCTDAREDWLPQVFGDQDDQWIASLFCLLTIYRELHKGLKSAEHCQLQRDAHNADEISQNLNHLLQVICPHRLFLQLAEFVGFDHLVLMDFLSSPETSFLPYFTQYLHLVGGSWTAFNLACIIHEKDQQTNVMKTEKSEDRCAEACENKILEKKPVGTEKNRSCSNWNAYQSSCIQPSDKLMKASLSSCSRLQESAYSIVLNKHNSSAYAEVQNVDLPLLYNQGTGTKLMTLVSYSDSDTEESSSPINQQRQKRSLSSDSQDENCSSVNETSERSSDDDNCNDIIGDCSLNGLQDGFTISENHMDQVMGMLIRLRLHIERLDCSGIFPYNARPLLLLLEQCENLYEM